jgi:hypothetical protein
LGSFGFVFGGVVWLPLSESVWFKVKLQVGNRFQVPRLVRWQFKLEPSQVLRVRVRVVGSVGLREDFLACMSRDGRVTIPRLIVELLTVEGEESLVGYAFEVALEPVVTRDELGEGRKKKDNEPDELSFVREKVRELKRFVEENANSKK